MNLIHYGLQRSGTNYLETLLTKNYKVRILNSNKDRTSPVQKHFRLYDQKDIISDPQYYNDIIIKDIDDLECFFDVIPDYYLVISKDPYSWYLSYSRWARKCRWPSVKHHYIEEYNLFYGKLLSLSEKTDRFIFVKYGDLLTDTIGTLQQLEYDMKLKKKLLSSIRMNVPRKVAQSKWFSDKKRHDYINKTYLSEYTSTELKELNNRLDSTVAGLLGYQQE